MNAADISVESGLENYRAGYFAKAESAFRQALTLQPDHPGAFNLLGVLTQQQGNISQAIEHFQHAIAAMPGWPEAWYNLGNARRDGGDFDGACKAYRQALALQPDFCDALNNLGLVLATIGAYDEAVAAFRTAMTHAPNNPNVINNLSALFLRMGRSTEAAILLARTEPEDAAAHNNRCVLLRSAGHLSQAAIEAHLAIDLDPSFVEAYNNLGLVLMDGRDLVGAAESFSKALSIRPDFFDAKSNLGMVRHLQGELDEALAIYDRLLTLYPNDARIFSQRGLVLLEMNRFDQAMNALEQAIALAPKWPEGYASMARLMIAMGRLDTAAILCRKAVAIDPNNAAARHEHATVSAMMFLGQVLGGNEPDGPDSAATSSPLPPRALRPGMVALENLFTARECAEIVAASAGLPPLPAQRPLVPAFPDFAALPLTSQSQWIYRRIGALVRILNRDIYRFDLNSGEPFRLIQWMEGGRGESWRSAAALITERPLARKLSLIVQLNDERDFEGGAIEPWQADKPVAAPRRLGEGVIFPAPALHRAAPVTRGVRQALLCNFNGPRFR